jgi:hypothetical protein
VLHHVNVWVDRWELNIGDSIIHKVQEAIDASSALLVVLSKSSTQSEWCKKEIDGGFLKELEEKRVFVLPVLLEDCSLPLFARGKIYADFRKSFDEGLTTILEGVAKITNPNLVRINDPGYYIDHGMDWGVKDNLIFLRLTYIEQAKNQPYTCLTVVEIFIEREAKTIYDTHRKNHCGAVARFKVLEALHLHLQKHGDIRPRLSDNQEQVYPLEFLGKNREHYTAFIKARRLGEDTGRDILIYTNNLIERSYQHEKEVLRIKDDV